MGGLLSNAGRNTGIQSVTYFQFQFIVLSAFIPCLTGNVKYYFRFSIRKFRQSVTFQYTVNENELRTKAPPDACRFRLCMWVGVERKGAEFTGYKQTNSRSRTHTHTHTQLYILDSENGV